MAFEPSAHRGRPGIHSRSLGCAARPIFERAADLARQEKAQATRRAYRSDFEIFRAWCADRGVSVLPAATESVAGFLAHEVEKGIRPSTIGRRVAAIRYAHKFAGHAIPTDDERVKATVRGIRRSLGIAPRKKAPATAERIIAMALGTGEGLKGIRDRAVLLLGFAGACRRSELVALDCDDLEEYETGLRNRDPPQQDRPGGSRHYDRRRAGLDRLPSRGSEGMARRRRHYQRGVVPLGPQGRQGRRAAAAQSVADIVKMRAEAVGLEPAQFAGHSLREGFLTSAANVAHPKNRCDRAYPPRAPRVATRPSHEAAKPIVFLAGSRPATMARAAIGHPRQVLAANTRFRDPALSLQHGFLPANLPNRCCPHSTSLSAALKSP